MTKKIKLLSNAEEIAKSRYFNNGEDWEQCTNRVSSAVASIEKEKILYTTKFQEIIYNMDFIPAGRILRNGGRPRGSMLNCYHLPCNDSIEEIGQFLKDSLILWSEGGGVGTNLSNLRPKGDPILGKGGISSGLVSFLRAADYISETIESGGQRRAAGLASLNVSHPEILDFIDAKMVHGTISHFNISVMVNDQFLQAVEQDTDWELKFKQKVYKKIRARDLWNKIITNMIKHAEPGLLNTTNLYKNNSYYYDPVSGTNPCVTGETLIYVADGRKHVPIKILAEEGKDIPVFSFNDVTKKIEVKMMRHPRITGYNKKILKIGLNDGSFIRCTENHKIYMKDGTKKEAKNLVIGDRLEHLISYNAPLEEIFPHSKSQESCWILEGGYPISEDRLISSFKIGKNLKSEEMVHHGDKNGLNNSFENLEVMSKIYEGNQIRDDNNPMIEISKYKGTSYERYLQIKDETDLDVFWDGTIIARKKCEGCGKDFNTSWDLREKSFCSISCYNYSNYRKEKIKEQYEFCSSPSEVQEYYSKNYQNYTITSIEEDGYENVYNGTVDDNHNFYSMSSQVFTESEKVKYNYILSSQCGEAVLAPYDACDLGALVLPNFITGNVNTNWQKLERVIKLAVRFLDNVIDVNKYSLQAIDIKAHNSRRIGLGVMGLADYLFAKELRYGSKEALLEIEKLFRFIRDLAYEASIELAVEKGSFPKFDPVHYGKSSFIRKLPAQLRLDIKEKGIRNVTLMSMAPTGTTSLLPEVSGGIEPLLFKSYKRRDRVGERIYIHPKYRQILLNDMEVPSWFVDINDLEPKDHFETQAIIQKYTDGAVSKTINLPKGITEDQLDRLLLEYIHDLKGVTIYVDGTREGQVYNRLTEEEIFNIIATETVGINNSMNIEDIECNCQKPKEEAEVKEEK